MHLVALSFRLFYAVYGRGGTPESALLRGLAPTKSSFSALSSLVGECDYSKFRIRIRVVYLIRIQFESSRFEILEYSLLFEYPRFRTTLRSLEEERTVTVPSVIFAVGEPRLFRRGVHACTAVLERKCGTNNFCRIICRRMR